MKTSVRRSLVCVEPLQFRNFFRWYHRSSNTSNGGRVVCRSERSRLTGTHSNCNLPGRCPMPRGFLSNCSQMIPGFNFLATKFNHQMVPSRERFQSDRHLEPHSEKKLCSAKTKAPKKFLVKTLVYELVFFTPVLENWTFKRFPRRSRVVDRSAP